MHFEQVSLEQVKEKIACGEISMMPSSDDTNGKEAWVRLCELAAIEQDSEKLITLVNGITRLLDEKEESLHKR
jgi:hypothetical protein